MWRKDRAQSEGIQQLTKMRCSHCELHAVQPRKEGKDRIILGQRAREGAEVRAVDQTFSSDLLLVSPFLFFFSFFLGGYSGGTELSLFLPFKDHPFFKRSYIFYFPKYFSDQLV